MIEASALRARSKTEILAGVSFALHQGVHSFVGGPTDGVGLLFSVIRGETPLSSGAIAWHGERRLTPRLRRTFAHIPLTPPTLTPLSVEEVLGLASGLRGEEPRDARERLAPLGLESLARRRVATLSEAELRAVLLSEALSSSVVSTILFEEPEVIASSVSCQLHALLSSWASEGRLCLLHSAGLGVAVRLADTILLLRRGALVRHSPRTDAFWARGDGGTAIQVVTADARGLVRELADDPNVQGIESHGGGVVVRGQDLTGLSRAITAAVLRAGTDVISIARCPAGIAEAKTPPDPPRPEANVGKLA